MRHQIAPRAVRPVLDDSSAGHVNEISMRELQDADIDNRQSMRKDAGES
jgi:hypothetical protein